MEMANNADAVAFSIELVVLVVCMFVALIGLIYRNLSNKVEKNETALGREVDRLSQNHNEAIKSMHMDLNAKINKMDSSLSYIKDETISKEQCQITQQLNEERNVNIHGRIDDVRELNREEHQELFNMIRTMNDTLTSVRDCVITIASGGDGSKNPPKVK